MDVYAYLFEDILLLCKCVNTKRGAGSTGAGGGGGGANAVVHHNSTSSTSSSSSQSPIGGSTNCCRLRPIHPPMRLSQLIVNSAGCSSQSHPTTTVSCPSPHINTPTPFSPPHSNDQITTTAYTSNASTNHNNNNNKNQSSQQTNQCHSTLSNNQTFVSHNNNNNNNNNSSNSVTSPLSSFPSSPALMSTTAPPPSKHNNNTHAMTGSAVAPPTSANFTVVYLNECGVATSAFLVNVGSPTNAGVWIIGINNAKNTLLGGKEQTRWDSFSYHSQQHQQCFPGGTTVVGGVGGIVNVNNSCEASPNQRKSSRIASHLKTFLTGGSTTGISTEDEAEHHHHHQQDIHTSTPVTMTTTYNSGSGMNGSINMTSSSGNSHGGGGIVNNHNNPQFGMSHPPPLSHCGGALRNTVTPELHRKQSTTNTANSTTEATPHSSHSNMNHVNQQSTTKQKKTASTTSTKQASESDGGIEKPFGSNSFPNLSIDCFGGHPQSMHLSPQPPPPPQLTPNSTRIPTNTQGNRLFATPNLSPPASPNPIHSPLTLSPKISNMCRRFMTSQDSQNSTESGSSSTTFFSSNGTFGIKHKQSKFSLPRRKISDSAVPISYQFHQQSTYYPPQLSSSACCKRNCSSSGSVDRSPSKISEASLDSLNSCRSRGVSIESEDHALPPFEFPPVPAKSNNGTNTSRQRKAASAYMHHTATVYSGNSSLSDDSPQSKEFNPGTQVNPITSSDENKNTTERKTSSERRHDIAIKVQCPQGNHLN